MLLQCGDSGKCERNEDFLRLERGVFTHPLSTQPIALKRMENLSHSSKNRKSGDSSCSISWIVCAAKRGGLRPLLSACRKVYLEVRKQTEAGDRIVIPGFIVSFFNGSSIKASACRRIRWMAMTRVQHQGQ